MKYFISLFKLPFWGLGVFLLLTLPACELLSNDPETNTDIPGLPPATQVGAETFGCLVNGEVWTPKGGAIGLPRLDLSYDPTYNGGTFDLRSTDYEEAEQSIIIFITGIVKPGFYKISETGPADALFRDFDTCWYAYEHYREGGGRYN